MCDPITATTLIVTGTQVASGVMQARNQMAEGHAANAYYKYLADQNVQQAKLVERTGQAQSRIIQDTAAYEGRRFKEQTTRQLSAQRAALAAAGVTGVTAEDVAGSSLRSSLLDESALRYNADIRSYEATEGAKSQAYSLNTQAEGFRFSGRNALSSAKRRAFGTLLGTAASVINPFGSIGGFAVPGMGGYGGNTPIGTINMGSYSRLPGR